MRYSGGIRSHITPNSTFGVHEARNAGPAYFPHSGATKEWQNMEERLIAYFCEYGTLAQLWRDSDLA